MVFNKKLIELRKIAGYTQEEMAKHLGINRGTYANYERGHREPDFETLKLIATWHGVSTDYLLGIEKGPEGELNPYQRQIYTWIMSLEHVAFHGGASEDINELVSEMEYAYELWKKRKGLDK